MYPRGFTLIELLVVIGITAVLGTTTMITLNPPELIRQSRDARRMQEIRALEKAMLSFLAAKDDPSALAPSQTCVDEASSTVFVSVSSDNGEMLPNDLPNGWTYSRVLGSSVRKADGTGWVPVDFANSAAMMSLLSTDPVNTFKDHLYYGYLCERSTQRFTFFTFFESKKYTRKKGFTGTDGGSDPFTYEVGSALIAIPLQPEAQWSLNSGGGGTLLKDESRNAHNGTWYNSPSVFSGDNCIEKECLNFDGVNQYGEVAIFSLDNWQANQTSFTLTTWAYPTGGLGDGQNNPIVDRGFIKPNGYGIWARTNTRFYGHVSLADALDPLGLPGSSVFSYNTWYHVALVYEWPTEKLRLYLNGVLEQEQNILHSQFNSISSYPWRIAAQSKGLQSGRYFQGRIDETIYYARALTGVEIVQHYQALTP